MGEMLVRPFYGHRHRHRDPTAAKETATRATQLRDLCSSTTVVTSSHLLISVFLRYYDFYFYGFFHIYNTSVLGACCGTGGSILKVFLYNILEVRIS